MMMPAFPSANLVVGKARFTLGSLNAFFDAMLGLGCSSELSQPRVVTRVGQVVVHFDHAFVVVTRIFGGTKLGAGGLVRAYSAAAGAVAASPAPAATSAAIFSNTY